MQLRFQQVSALCKTEVFIYIINSVYQHQLIFLHNRFYDEEDTVNYNQDNNPVPPQTYDEYTTLPPYYNYYQYQSEDPYVNNQYNSPSTKNYISFKPFSISTTRSPYNFENFAQQYNTQTNYYPPQQQQQQTTKNPYVGNYYQIIQQTTKNPYDFANFGKNYHDNVNNNYLKRSYNAASYYSDSSNVRNVTANFNNRRVYQGQGKDTNIKNQFQQSLSMPVSNGSISSSGSAEFKHQ